MVGCFSVICRYVLSSGRCGRWVRLWRSYWIFRKIEFVMILILFDDENIFIVNKFVGVVMYDSDVFFFCYLD